MNIAIVGAGADCLAMMEYVSSLSGEQPEARIVAVADERPDAPGIVQARLDGIAVTDDYHDLLARDDLDMIVELSGSPDVFEDILRHKKRTVRLINRATFALFSKMSGLVELEKQTNMSLQKTRALHNLVMNELIREDVLVISPDYRILDINETLLRKIGLTREAVIGRTCFEVTHHFDQPCYYEDCPCPLKETLHTRQPSTATHIHYDKDNHAHHMSISCYPLLSETGVIGAVEISKDITQEINLQKMMMQQEKLAAIGRLSAGVAHEINNPLTTILTSVMLLQEDLDPSDPTHQELQTVAAEALRCRKIVTSLLDFARQEGATKRRCDLNQIARDSLVLTGKQAAFKNIRLEQILAPNLPPVCVDKGQLQQAFINLIINAIEATDPDGVITVETSGSESARYVTIQVRDTGTGIRREDLDRIFDPFFTTKEQGTGLGLAVTHGIVEQHDGRISVESKPGAGTVFTIKLPKMEPSHGKS